MILESGKVKTHGIPWKYMIKPFPFVSWKTDIVETKYIALGWKIGHY